MEKTYTTKEASELTGIPLNTIRSWMSRHAGMFLEGEHYIIEASGRKLWTAKGIEFLKTKPPSNSNTENTETSNYSDVIEPILELASKHLAYEFWKQLPVRTLQRIQQMRVNPTDEERELMQQSAREALSIGTFEILPSYIRGLPDAED